LAGGAVLTVHHLENSRSQRVLWLLEELRVPYDVKIYKRDANYLAPTELKKIHPLGKAPVIVTSEGEVVAETGAIMDYILHTYDGTGLIPQPKTKARNAFTYWMFYAEGSAMQPLLLKLVVERIRSKTPLLARPIASRIADKIEELMVRPNLEVNIDFWEKTLSDHEWFAGEDFTAADIMMSFPVEAAAARAGAGSRPHVRAWLDRIHARPAYGRALERGGPYAYA
jgi:glutathione S-transferase